MFPFSKFFVLCGAFFAVIMLAGQAVASSDFAELPADVCDATVDWGFDPARTCYGAPRATDFGNTYVYRPDQTEGQLPSPYRAARALPGQSQALDVWGQCRYVSARGKDAIFIPFGTAQEWEAFINAAGTSGSALSAMVSLFSCARETASFPVPAGDSLCTNVAVHLPYAPVGARIQKRVDFACRDMCHTNTQTGQETCSPWHQSAVVSFQAMNAETSGSQGGWAIAGPIAYENLSGAAP